MCMCGTCVEESVFRPVWIYAFGWGVKSGCMPFAGLCMTVSLCVSVWYISVPGCVYWQAFKFGVSVCVCDTIWCVSVGSCGSGCIYT